MKTRLSLLLLCSSLFASFAGAKEIWYFNYKDAPLKATWSDDGLLSHREVWLTLKRYNTTLGSSDIVQAKFLLTEVNGNLVQNDKAKFAMKKVEEVLSFLKKYKVAELATEVKNPLQLNNHYILDRLLFSGLEVTAVSNQTNKGATDLDYYEYTYYLSRG